MAKFYCAIQGTANDAEVGCFFITNHRVTDDDICHVISESNLCEFSANEYDSLFLIMLSDETDETYIEELCPADFRDVFKHGSDSKYNSKFRA